MIRVIINIIIIVFRSSQHAGKKVFLFSSREFLRHDLCTVDTAWWCVQFNGEHIFLVLNLLVSETYGCNNPISNCIFSFFPLFFFLPPSQLGNYGIGLYPRKRLRAGPFRLLGGDSSLPSRLASSKQKAKTHHAKYLPVQQSVVEKQN